MSRALASASSCCATLTAVIFVAVFLYFGLQAPRFFGAETRSPTSSSRRRFTGIIAVGMTFVLLTAGIDLSVGSNMYLSAMAAGYLLQNPALQNGWGVALAILAGLATGRSSAPSTASASWCCASRRSW